MLYYNRNKNKIYKLTLFINYKMIFQAANRRVVKGKMNFVLALAMSFSELFTKFAMPIFSKRPFCQTTIANFVTNVEKIKRIEI
jgi:hypothetical protein